MVGQLRQQGANREREESLRRSLGIPADAARAIVFAESSHWDPDWVYTSDEYYRRFVQSNVDLALDELDRDARRVYSVECMFFLRMYWDRQPQQRDRVRRFVNDGRLRLTSSGVTTADTLLPSTEAILRDFLMGQEWLRGNGMTREPRLAYFTDSFGCSPALPSLLKAAGFDQTAITRIDGMYFAGCDFEPPARFPRASSSADLLLNRERTLDFVWRGPDGAEVLCHWNAYTYGQGDLLAHRGINRVYLFPVAIPDRSDRNVARRIRRYIAQLAPYSRTPYLFCPIGFDFVSPIPELVTLLDRYNRRHYPSTGVWAVNAGLDDYLDLVDCHRDELPVLAFDPNPYWTGFYTSRPTLKEKCHDLVERLLIAEQLALLPENKGAERTIAGELEGAWWHAVVANHHDFITGTSPDRVVEAEQIPWLEGAITTVENALSRLSSPIVQALGPPDQKEQHIVPAWRRQDGLVEVRTAHYKVELAEEMGGGIVHAKHTDTGIEWLASGPEAGGTGVSNDLISYRDSGGLWRMGHEFFGGSFKAAARASDRPARLDVREHATGLEVFCDTTLDGQTIRRRLWFRNDSPLIHMRVEGRAAERRTVTVLFHTPVSASQLAMDQPGAVVPRPPEKIYKPTFWPMQHFAHVQDDSDGRGFALCLRRPGAVSYQPPTMHPGPSPRRLTAGKIPCGTVETIALRNATRERVFGFVPLTGTPATGHERGTYAFDYGILYTPAGDWRENDVSGAAFGLAPSPWEKPIRTARGEAVAGIGAVDRPDVFVAAAKPASRGDGIIVRLFTYTTPGPDVVLTLGGRAVRAARLCDARERDLGDLEVRAGMVHLTMPGAIATVRILG